MKKLEISLLAALALCILGACAQIPFAKACEDIRADTLRLHVIANSDEAADQAVKLAVRDAILAQSETLFCEADSKQAAERALESRLAEIKRIADETLASRGFDYTARVTVAETQFDTRTYESFVLPAGNYTALRVELGAAQGKNWWCVLYPALCVPTAQPDEPLEDYTEQEREIVTGGEKYEIRFKLEELFQSWFGSRENPAAGG